MSSAGVFGTPSGTFPVTVTATAPPRPPRPRPRHVVTAPSRWWPPARRQDGLRRPALAPSRWRHRWHAAVHLERDRPAHRRDRPLPASCPARPRRRHLTGHGDRDRRRPRTAQTTVRHRRLRLPVSRQDHPRDPGHGRRLAVRRATSRPSRASSPRATPTVRHHGFVIQTPGYDPAADATPGASDAVFVYHGGRRATRPRRSATTSASSAAGSASSPASPRSPSPTVRLRRDPVRDRLPRRSSPAPSSPAPTASQGACPTGAALDALREAHEHEAFLPTGSPHRHRLLQRQRVGSAAARSMRGEFRLAATHRAALHRDRGDPGRRDAGGRRHAAFNARTRVASTTAPTSTTDAVDDTAGYPWLTLTNTVRVGAKATFVKPVVLDYRFDLWRLHPQPHPARQRRQRRRSPSSRTAPPPRTTCSAPTATSRSPRSTCSTTSSTRRGLGRHRRSTRTRSTRRCRATPQVHLLQRPRGQPRSPRTRARGATRAPSRRAPCPTSARAARRRPSACARQQAKEVAAINTMDADVMSLEEVENPVKLGYSDRDAALKVLVAALNADWDATHPGQDPQARQALGLRRHAARRRRSRRSPEQDAIRSAFIYNPRAGRDGRPLRDPRELAAVPQRPRAAGAGLQVTSTAPATTPSS